MDPSPSDDRTQSDPPAELGRPRLVSDPARDDQAKGALRHPFREARETIEEAATEAELLTGHREETVREARMGVLRRVLRAFGGFLLISIGITLLPLPGPGWLIIIVGLAMMPFAWAERTIVQIRRRIPGIPEEGKVPLTTWIIMGLMVAIFTAIPLLFGRQIGEWASDTWNDLWG